MELIRKYFPGLDTARSAQLETLLEVVPELNRKVNIISRRDVGHLEERHILYSLAVARLLNFGPGETVIDAGTGGGFPGIPLAILFPETRFLLVDSIGKKIRMVHEACKATGLKNVLPVHSRVEELENRAEFVISRAVAPFPQLYRWTYRLITPSKGETRNGLVALKGGDLESELAPFRDRVELHPVSSWYSEPFFSTKTIVYLKK